MRFWSRAVLAAAVAVLYPPDATASGGQDPQVGSTRYRVISTKKSAFQPELDRAAAEGHRVVAADASLWVAIADTAAKETGRRSYRFVEHLEKALSSVEPGYRLLPESLTGEGEYSAIFERVEGDDAARAYRFLRDGSVKGLEKKVKAAEADGFSLLGIAAAQRGYGAIVERSGVKRSAMLLATARTGTLQQELTAAVSQGYRLLRGTGYGEVAYALAQSPEDRPAPEYLVVAAGRSSGLEDDLNAAAANGFRLIPQSIAWYQKSFLGSKVTSETVVVMERMTDPPAVVYRVLGTRRMTTLQKELAEASAQGFELSAFVIGDDEQVAVLQRSK